MADLIALLQHNTGLLVMAGLVGGFTAVVGLMTWLMRRAGSSVRPIVFFAVYAAIILLPQVVGHLALATRPGSGALGTAPTRPPVPAVEIEPVDTANASTQDVSALYASRMPGLRSARLLQWPAGDSLTDLRFEHADQAGAALMSYLQMHQVAPSLDRGGNEVRGTRGLGGGVVHLLRQGAQLRVVTALDDTALDRRLAAVQAPQAAAAVTRSTAADLAEAEPLVPALQPLVRLFREHVLLQVTGMLLLLVVAVVWFFRGSAWAVSLPPQPRAAFVPTDSLRRHLLDLGTHPDLPVDATVQADGRIAVTWRHGDARWLDLAGASLQRRTHRLLLQLDEARRTVFVTEQWSRLDAHAGAHGASLQWHAARGINFFQVEQGGVLGVMLGPDGRPTGALAHRWKFDLQEMKAPFIAAVTGSGWHWRPVMHLRATR